MAGRRAPQGSRRPSWTVPLLLALAGCHPLQKQAKLPAEASEQAAVERIVPPELAGAARHPADLPPGEPPALPDPDGPGELTLAGALEFGARNNPLVRAAASRAAAARYGQDAAFGDFLPQLGLKSKYVSTTVPVLPGGDVVTATLTPGVEQFMIAEAGGDWVVTDFGRRAGKYGQARSRVEQAVADVDRVRQAVAFDVARAYFRVLLAHAVAQVREQAVRQADAVLNDTRVRRANGTADREAVLRAEVEVSQAQEELVASRQGIADAGAVLNRALGRSPLAPVSVQDLPPPPAVSPSVEEELTRAVAARPEVAQARAEVAEAAFGVKAAKAELLPRVYVRGTVLRVDSPGALEGWVAAGGFHIDQPLYAGGRYKAELRRDQARVVALTAGLQSVLDRVGLEVAQAYQAIGTAREKIRLGEVAVNQAAENLRLTEVKYRNGDASPTDVVDAQTALVRARTRYHTAVYEYLDGLARLEYATGGDQSRLLELICPAGR